MEVNELFVRRTILLAAMRRACCFGYCKYEVERLSKIIDTIVRNENHHYLAISIEDDKKISFADNAAEALDNTKRKKTTLNAYIRSILKATNADISDYALGKFVENVNTFVDLIKNKSVSYYTGYELKNLGEYFDPFLNISKRELLFYSNNKEKVGLLVAANFSRALMWVCNDGTKLIRVVDVQYPKDHRSDVIRKWAKDRNILLIQDVPKDMLNRLHVKLNYKYVEEIPYQDSFKYANIDIANKRDIVISTNPSYGNLFIGDEYQPHLRIRYCSSCDLTSEVSTVKKIEGVYFCSKCIESKFKFCDVCSGYKSTETPGYTQPRFIKYADRSSEFDSKEKWVCDDCLSNSKYYKKCEHCDEYSHMAASQNVKVNYTVSYYCNNCIDKHIGRCEKCYQSKFISPKFGKMLCKACADEYKMCTICSAYENKYSMQDLINKEVKTPKGICRDCITKTNARKCADCFCFMVDSKSYEVLFTSERYSSTRIICAACKTKLENMDKSLKETTKQLGGPYGYYGRTTNSYKELSKTVRFKDDKDCDDLLPLQKHRGDYYGFN